MTENQMIILSAGMPRSASTWLFNVARLALEKVDGLDLGSGWIDEMDTFRHHACLLVKVHEYDESLVENATAITYTYRDLRDALASAKRKFGAEPDLEMADNYLKNDVVWRGKAGLAMKYEDFLVSRIEYVEKLLGLFGIEGLPAQSLLEEVDGLQANRDGLAITGHDAENLLHPGHITDGRHGSWEGVLEANLVKEIEKRYDWWFHENGYAYG